MMSCFLFEVLLNMALLAQAMDLDARERAHRCECTVNCFGQLACMTIAQTGRYSSAEHTVCWEGAWLLFLLQGLKSSEMGFLSKL